ncbi:MAG TPA: hypothetical protein VF194_15495 [Ferrovibrio sp.]|jgi:hypothetical protein|uniref:hypothetical protein n=1 Tax=Ferrovibrio sp. TaxID=1917215 RepID=UPI002ED5D530
MHKRLSHRADIGSELQDQFRSGYRPSSIAGPDEDPNVGHACYASPPCYMHELDPTCFETTADTELAALLRELLAEWTGAIPPIDAMCAAITEGVIAADLRKIRDQTVAHCQKLEHMLGPSAALPARLTDLTLHDFMERSHIRHRLIDRAKSLLPQLSDRAARDTLARMVNAFPDTELTILVAATLLHLNS